MRGSLMRGCGVRWHQTRNGKLQGFRNAHRATSAPTCVTVDFCVRHISLTLENCEIPGFDADLEDVHYFIGHETVIRRPHGSKMRPVAVGLFAFLTRIASRAPDFFRIPQDRLSEVGFRVEI
jgi:K+ transporter